MPEDGERSQDALRVMEPGFSTGRVTWDPSPSCAASALRAPRLRRLWM